MTEVLTGTLRGRVITLDAEESALTEQTATEELRVRVAVDLLDGAGDADAGESAELLKSWAEQGPQGPIEALPRAEAADENPGLVLSDEQQRRLLRAWADHGPQGPIES